jgi:NAD(P)-dependent dehydrogenase (short-subunit alcohol dehydrogenase family)
MRERPVILITGATDGLGRALAARLAGEGAQLLLHGRDRGRLDETASEVAAAGGPPPQTFVADLASLADVRALAADVRGATERLDVLVSNAGIGSGRGGPGETRERQLSADGYELRFAVNYLAGFLLTQELLDLVRASAPARIVYVASLGQHPLDFDDLMLEHDYSGGRAYAQSKLAQIMSGFELATQLPAGEVTVNSLHPSTYMPTKMVINERGSSIDTLEQGVDATRRLCLDEELADVTGRFFDRFRDAQADPQAYDTAARAELWLRSEELVGR